jgi:Pro-kumamolisin, activation domain/Abnormal spindle-like microcephaly-assoc'd, ASPM-SPD-2-Hydin
MHRYRTIAFPFLVLIAAVLISSPSVTQAQSQSAPTTNSSLAPSRIIEKIDDSKLIALRGNVHPGAVSANDRGAIAGETQLNRIVLVLQRSTEQESALEALMAEQKDPSSPNFHQWLTPEQFGQQYGISDQDLSTITAWLQSHGFTIDNVSKGRVTVEFSGTAAAVAQAFHTEIHHYVVNGVEHIANNSDPQIPAALAPVVQGVASLNNFFPQHQHVMGQRVRYNTKTHTVSPITADNTPARLANSTGLTPASKLNATSPLPQLTTTGTSGATHEDITPYDFATIYNVLPLWNAGINGTGISIAISGVSDINLNDISTFQAVFGLPANAPTVIHNGADPGESSSGAGENELDVEWSGAVAPKAKIIFVVSGSTSTTFGGQLSDSYIVDNKTANIMSASYGTCELNLGSSGNAAYNSIWQQGAAEGISIMESAGDQGSAGCSSQDTAAPNADKTGLVVNGMASSPYVTSVGGTDFYWQAAPSTYWNSSNASNGSSAKGYIPEEVWNSTCSSSYLVAYFGEASAEQTCNDALNSDSYYGLVVIAGGSGGVSNCTAPTGTTIATCTGGYAKPTWQAATGVPADGKRDVPDVSLFAAGGLPDGLASSAYLVCETINTSTCNYSAGEDVELQEIGGTSASSPAFAGIMALVLQKTGEAQGLANVEFYKFFAAENLTNCKSASVTSGTSCIFYDTTLSTNAQVCNTGAPDCVTNTAGDEVGILSGYKAGTGYDLATGLGSVNAENLVNAAWPTKSGGGSPVATLSATSLAFGNQSVGVRSAAKTVTLTNTGTATLSSIAIVPSGNTSSFSETNNCPASLNQNASCTISVTFDPNGALAKSLTVTITDNAGTQTITATGTGVASGGSVAVSPSSLSFGDQTVGVKSAAKTATLTNSTSSSVTGVTITTSGNTSSFTQTNNCPTTLDAGKSCTFSVTFDPNGAVAKSMTITIKDSAGTQTVTSTGNGVAAGGSVSVSPSSLSFGNQTIGVKSAAKTATLTNGTSSNVTGLTIATSGNTSSFTQTNNCPTTLDAGKSCTFSVTFDPNGAVAKSMTITIKDSAGTQTITSTGTGVAGKVTLSPSSLAFGNQTVGVKSAAKTATLINETTSSLTGITISTSGNTSSFSQTNNCPTSLNAGATCTFSITFDPNGAVAKSMTITIKDSAGAQTITSTGTGVN